MSFLRTILGLSAFFMLVPLSAHALVVETSASAQSGGMTVTSGQSASSGDSSASVDVRTTSSDGGSQSTVETDINGVRTTETYAAPAGLSVDVSTTTPSGARVELHVRAGGTSSSSFEIRPAAASNAARAASNTAASSSVRSALHAATGTVGRSDLPKLLATTPASVGLAFPVLLHDFFAHLFGFFGIAI